jgi:plasmid stability protein
MSLIADTLLSFLPAKRKHTPSGWIGFNAPCCGDKRQRGGFIQNAGDAVSYHCFNCGFKASWQPGRTISAKMNKLMRLLNMPDDIINQLRLEALRLNDNSNAEVRQIIPKFEARALPPESEPIVNFLDSPPEKLIPVLEYLYSRNLFLEDYPFYWTPKIGFSNRVIIPFYKDGVIVGYTARSVNDVKPKYISEQQPGYVFNLDKQSYERNFVIVCEGPIDAISIDATALMGAEIKDSQNWLLKQLNKEIILVPDRDHEGPRTVEQALEFGWSVSMPDWPEGIKDVNDAVVKLGRLATLHLILTSKESNGLKIQLRAKKWFKEENVT